MVDQTRPASKPCRKMKRPLWMGEFDGMLSVPGKGCFSGCYQGMSCGMTFSRGTLQLFRKKQNWMVRFDPDGQHSPFQRTLSSNFNIQGYLQERSFYKNFVQHGKIQIHFGQAAFLQFDFDNLERDEEMLKKISTVFEYFFSKDENYLPRVNDTSAVEEIPFATAQQLEGHKLLTQSTLSHNLFNKQSHFPTPSNVKSVSSPEIQPMVEDDEPKRQEIPIARARAPKPEGHNIFAPSTLSYNLFNKQSEFPTPSDVKSVSSPEIQPMIVDDEPKRQETKTALFSGGYISDLMLHQQVPATKPDQLNGRQKDVVPTLTNDTPRSTTSPVKMNGILSPSSKNNIIKNETPFANGPTSGKHFLTSDQCRNPKDSVKRCLNKSNVNNTGSANQLSAPSTLPTTPKSFYGPNRNSGPRRRPYDEIGRDQSPYFSNSQRQGRGYSSLSATAAKREREKEVSHSAVCANAGAKKLRLAKQRDEKENSFRDHQGFVNIHNSCYMNATLQALFSFPILISHLSNEKYDQIDDGLLLAFLELNRIRFQTVNSRKSGLLSAFKEKMIKASNNFKESGRHEDAHEYYLSFKESLQQEVQRVFPHDSAIDDILNVEMVETRMCPTCSKHSKNANVNQQTHSELGVDIPEETVFGDNFKLKGLIESTLKSSTVPFNCECGETYVDLLKRFSRLPKILVIHLHRYCLKDGVIEKNLSNIDVPENLDLQWFCTPNVSTPRIDEKNDMDSDYGDDDGSNECKYQLQAVIEHLGSWASGGHYIARVRHKGMWLKCDDESITEMDEDVADSCQQSAYLLFYIHSSQVNEVG